MRPEMRILANREDITSRIRDRLLRLTISDKAGMESDQARIELDDRGASIALPPTGAELDISLGYSGKLSSMGKWIVDEIELPSPPRSMSIRARAADLLQGIKSPKTRSWDDISLGDLVRTVAKEHGYRARVADGLAKERLAHVDQTEESDLHLLTRLAERYGAVAKPANLMLLFVPEGQAKSASGKELPTISLRWRDLIDHRARLSERSQYQAVKAHWHDKEAAQRKSVLVGEGEPVYTLQNALPSEGEALVAARSKLQDLQRGSSTLEATVTGNPAISAEAKISVTGVRDGVDGEWVATRVRHMVDESGYRTSISAEVPGK